MRPTFATDLCANVVRSLTDCPKSISTRWVFDARGGLLYENAISVPQYYITAAETRLLSASAREVSAATRAKVLIDMGCGSAVKTRLLIEALNGGEGLAEYVPWDLNEEAVTRVAEEFADNFPRMDVVPVVGDFQQDYVLSWGHPRLIIFLGCTLGNLSRPDRQALLSKLSFQLDSEDSLLFAVDLFKSPARLLGAYSGDAPVQLFKNALVRLNREFDADFNLEAFTYRPRWNDDQRQIEHLLQSVVPQCVTLARLGVCVDFARDEVVRVGISAKPSMGDWTSELLMASLEVERWWLDEENNYGLCLARRASCSPDRSRKERHVSCV